MGIITTIPEKCRRCYTCVRECPAKAIKVEHGQATVIAERCIACGNCIKVCAMKAKQIEDGTAKARELLSGPAKTVACLAPSFAAAFADQDPGKIIAGLKRLGATEVWNVAFGAELVSRKYAELHREMKSGYRSFIATPCPAIVAYIEQYVPALVPSLAPIVSPMIATARAIHQRHGREARVIFIGPCTAKKAEINDPPVAGEVDCALTYAELAKMFEEAGIVVSELEAARFDGPPAYSGESFPLPGGLLKSAGLAADILVNDIITVEGKDRVLGVLNDLSKTRTSALLVDALFCEGCISGPIMQNDLSVFTRKQILIEYINLLRKAYSAEEAARARDEFKDLDLSRTFAARDIELPMPSPEELDRVLRSMKKATPEDQLNCGACGYPTCYEKALAVYQGLAEASMCLPYLIEELEVTCQELSRSNQDLASTQEQLLHAERLASLGQLSAGVAHEINNPLGSILLFSYILLKTSEPGTKTEQNLQMIVSEATRCKNIVRGLLDFARKSPVSKAPTNLAGLIQEVITIVRSTAEVASVRLTAEIAPDLPIIMIDGVQIKQMLMNLVQNSIDAISGSGEVTVKAKLLDPDDVEIAVVDTGCGIPKENLSKIFTPFFTTKTRGKGTGLGMAIAYGVVKMHSGDITVSSEINKGTTIRIKIPVNQPDQTQPGDFKLELNRGAG